MTLLDCSPVRGSPLYLATRSLGSAYASSRKRPLPAPGMSDGLIFVLHVYAGGRRAGLRGRGAFRVRLGLVGASVTVLGCASGLIRMTKGASPCSLSSVLARSCWLDVRGDTPLTLSGSDSVLVPSGCVASAGRRCMSVALLVSRICLRAAAAASATAPLLVRSSCSCETTSAIVLVGKYLFANARNGRSICAALALT